MKLNLTEGQKKAALEAGKQGMKNAYEKSKSRPGLTWWERLLWVVLAGVAYAASSLLSGCGHTIDVTAERTEICRDGACWCWNRGACPIPRPSRRRRYSL